LAHLERHGASFMADIARATRLLPAAAEEALWTLVARGLVTGDGAAGLRTLLKPDSARRPRRLRAVRGGRARLVPAGRWAALRAVRRRGAEAPETVVVAAADPLNLVGVLVPGARLSPMAHEVIAFRDGAAVETGELGAVLSRLKRASG